MPFQVIPKENAFFDLFHRAAANVVAAARELAELTGDLADGETRAARIKPSNRWTRARPGWHR